MSNQMAKVLTFGVSGVNGFPVQTEVFCVDGMPMMEIIGLPDTAVRESKNRINAAIISSGVKLPVSRVTFNLAPAVISILTIPHFSASWAWTVASAA